VWPQESHNKKDVKSKVAAKKWLQWKIMIGKTLIGTIQATLK